jgi:uncharacterized membrane protein YsdA (DUF1294 family)/cold shock CspA family protein
MRCGTIAASPRHKLAMRHQGRLSHWNDDKGFGFVAPTGGGDRAFVHIKAFAQATRRPVDGDALTYATVRDARGRLQATAIRFADEPLRQDPAPSRSVRPPPTRPPAAKATPARSTAMRRGAAAEAPSRGTFAYVLVGTFALALAGLIATGRLPVHAGTLYVAMSLGALWAYRGDKRAAAEGRWRTPESTLHLLALCGGWPGALLAQRWFRHKSRKTEFLWTFRATVVANVVVLAWYAGR